MSLPKFRINYLVNNIVTHIFIFDGYKVNDVDIRNENASEIIVNENIYIDDTILDIKLKIFNVFNQNGINDVSVDDMYLFCIKDEIISPELVYQLLTQNNKIELDKSILSHFLLNFVNEDGTPAEFDLSKDIYEFDDIVPIFSKHLITNILGQPFKLKNNIIANPYNSDSGEQSEKLTSVNGKLLLNTGEFVNNNIYICSSTNLPSNIIKYYFPTINVANKMEKSNQLFRSLSVNFENVNMFYQVNQLKTETLKTTTGINGIKLAIHPLHNIKLPLDIIFKIMQTTVDNPLIKYNPMTGQDKLYRLYTNALTKDGVKIPMLPSSIIFKLVNEIGKSKSVTFYIIYEKYAILCEFNSNGDIILSSTFDSLSLEDIGELFKNAVNPIILKIKEFLEKNGYKFFLFNRITDTNIEILNINYHSEIEINKLLTIDKFKKWIGNIFAIEENTTDDVLLRFKRVSDFSR